VFRGEAAAGNKSRATMPLERYVLNSGASNRVMCVTCHNPHGTDLLTYTGGAVGNFTKVPNNKMLRMRFEDNTLCEGCH
jgi:hypothetical protein